MKEKNQVFILPFFINFTTEKPNSGEEFLIIEVFPLISEDQMKIEGRCFLRSADMDLNNAER